MTPILEVRSVSKEFPGVRALDRVCLQLAPGEVLAVIGENGAGKSTLMKILAGIETPDDGEICLNGRAIQLTSPRQAQRLGIALIHQELNLADNLDIASNLFLGREPSRFLWRDRRRLEDECAAVLGQLGLRQSPRRRVSELSLGQQQLVEIAKALSTDARVIIMDEPTSSLSSHDTENLYRVIRELSARGVAIVYISHRLGEVRDLAHRVMVLRDGKNAGELAREEISHDAMARLMVGRDFQFQTRRVRDPEAAPTPTVLAVNRLRTDANANQEVSFSLKAGEVVGIAGLVGAGRTELLRVLFGIDPAAGGEIQVEGKNVEWRHPQDAIRAGLALAPEDRKQQGIILEMAIRENLSLASLQRESRNGFLRRSRERDLAREMIGRLRIKTPSETQAAQNLSGGNQQKVVIGKWLALRPRILLLDEPTRGIDVSAKQEIYRLIEELAEQGMAILFVSSEMEEILRLAQRVLVMYQGKLTGELRASAISEEAIIRLATGSERIGLAE